MLAHWSDTFHRIFDCIMAPIALLFNLSLLVIIKKYTPESLKTFSAIILITTLCDLITPISQLFVTARFI
uniref:Uncharacterized protein n=2 Tax=Caenorhabditis japonica TaxID=281687 RepID=A0A8R1EMM3_CAEJA